MAASLAKSRRAVLYQVRNRSYGLRFESQCMFNKPRVQFPVTGKQSVQPSSDTGPVFQHAIQGLLEQRSTFFNHQDLLHLFCQFPEQFRRYRILGYFE
jgi:hypothetical protein